jgi:hypothetical protein
VAEQGPLEKPAHLRPPDGGGSWIAKRPAAAVALLLGVLAFLIAAVANGQLSTTPDPRLTVPGFAVTALAALVSLARREPQGYFLWALGVGLAAAALVLGWFLMLAIVVGATAVVILILHAVM